MKTSLVCKDAHGCPKLKYDSLEEELAQFRDTPSNYMRFIGRLRQRGYIDFYKLLISFALFTSLVMIFLFLVL